MLNGVEPLCQDLAEPAVLAPYPPLLPDELPPGDPYALPRLGGGLFFANLFLFSLIILNLRRWQKIPSPTRNINPATESDITNIRVPTKYMTTPKYINKYVITNYKLSKALSL